jgi:hypothetical protein
MIYNILPPKDYFISWAYFFYGKPSSRKYKNIKRNMGNHISEINQNKGCDTWIKDAFSIAKRS